MIRRTFLRMAFAATACGMLGVDLERRRPADLSNVPDGFRWLLEKFRDDGRWLVTRVVRSETGASVTMEKNGHAITFNARPPLSEACDVGQRLTLKATVEDLDMVLNGESMPISVGFYWA